MKKMAILVIVVALLISMSSTAFAAGTGKMAQETKGTAVKLEQKMMKKDGPTYMYQMLQGQCGPE